MEKNTWKIEFNRVQFMIIIASAIGMIVSLALGKSGALLVTWFIAVFIEVFEPNAYKMLRYNEVLHVMLFSSPLFVCGLYVICTLPDTSVSRNWPVTGIVLVMLTLLCIYNNRGLKDTTKLVSQFGIGKRRFLVEITRVIVPIISEEFYFRLFISFAMDDKRVVDIIAVETFLFVLYHLANRWNHAVLNIAKVFEIIGLSMLLGILYSSYHSIVLCIVWHALFDFSAGYVLLVRLRKAKPHPVIFDEYE